MSTNFHLAPPAKLVDGLLAMPIDISSIAAVFSFDGAAMSALADATIAYEVGPTAGHPIVDLGQTPAQDRLDGAVFPVAQLAHHSFRTGAFTDLRVIEGVQAAGAVRTLRVQYNLALPYAQFGGSYLSALNCSAGPRLRFAFGFSDLNRLRYAEAGLPVNLPFEQQPIALEIPIVNTMAANPVVSNSMVTSLGSNHWRIAFPSRFTALPPLLKARSSDTLQQHSGAVDPLAFDFGDQPILPCLCDPSQRHTPSNSCSDGSRFWQGMTSMMGEPTLNALMAQLYQTHKGQALSTQVIAGETRRLCRVQRHRKSGQIVGGVVLEICVASPHIGHRYH